MPRPATLGRLADISGEGATSSTRRWANSRSPMPTRPSATMRRCGPPFARAPWRCSWSTERRIGRTIIRREPMRSVPVLDDHETPGSEVSAEPSRTSAGLARRVGAFLLREFLEILPPTIFFIIGFNLIVLTTNLILADYGGQFAGFMIATASALIAAKALLVANAMPLRSRALDPSDLVQNIFLLGGRLHRPAARTLDPVPTQRRLCIRRL